MTELKPDLYPVPSTSISITLSPEECLRCLDASSSLAHVHVSDKLIIPSRSPVGTARSLLIRDCTFSGGISICGSEDSIVPECLITLLGCRTPFLEISGNVHTIRLLGVSGGSLCLTGGLLSTLFVGSDPLHGDSRFENITIDVPILSSLQVSCRATRVAFPKAFVPPPLTQTELSFQDVARYESAHSAWCRYLELCALRVRYIGGIDALGR